MFDPRSKPERGTYAVDRSHPLADGLRGLWLFDEGGSEIVQNAVRFDMAGAMSSSARGCTARGVAIVHNAQADRTTLARESTLLLNPSSVCITLAYRKLDATNRESGAIGVDTSAEPGGAGTSALACGVHLPWSDGTVYWDFGASRLQVGGLTFRDDVWSFCAGVRGMEIWQSGVRRANSATIASRTNAPGLAFRLGTHASSASFAISGDLAAYAFVMVHDRPPLPATIAQLHAEPYAMLRPLVSRAYSVPAGLLPYRRKTA